MTRLYSKSCVHNMLKIYLNNNFKSTILSQFIYKLNTDNTQLENKKEINKYKY